MNIYKIFMTFCFFLIASVNAAEYTALCESCSDIQSKNIAVNHADLNSSSTTVNIVDTDNGQLRRYRVIRIPNEDFDYERRHSDRYERNTPLTFETRVIKLSATAEMIEEAKEFKGLMQRLEPTNSTDKDIVGKIGDKLIKHYGNSIGRSNFTIVRLPSTGYPQSASSPSITVTSIDNIAIVEYIQSRIGIKHSNTLFAMLATNVFGAAIVVFPDGSIRIYVHKISAIPYELTDIIFDPSGELIEEALNNSTGSIGTGGGGNGEGTNGYGGSYTGGGYGYVGGGSQGVCTGSGGAMRCYTVYY